MASTRSKPEAVLVRLGSVVRTLPSGFAVVRRDNLDVALMLGAVARIGKKRLTTIEGLGGEVSDGVLIRFGGEAPTVNATVSIEE